MKVLSFKPALTAVFILLSFSSYAKKSVLVIESYTQEYPWDTSYTRAITDALGRDIKLTFFEMNCKRVCKESCKRNSDRAWRRYLSLNPDLVVIGDDFALKFLGERFAGRKTPVVFLGINNNPRNYFNSRLIPANMTGVMERPPLRRAVQQIVSIMPRAKRTLMIMDTTLTSRIAVTRIFGDQKTIQVSGVKVSYVQLDTLNAISKTVSAAAQSNDFIILGLYQNVKDGAKKVHSNNVAKYVSDISKVPVYGLWDFAIGEGKAIGGFVVDPYDMGIISANIVTQILGGIKPKSISPVFFDQSKSLFSLSGLKKWNLKLPDEIAKRTVFTR